MTTQELVIGILAKAGSRGLSVASVVRHVYNNTNSLFEPADAEKTRRTVSQYLQYHSRKPSALIERTGKRGYYRLNTTGNQQARQAVINLSKAQKNTDLADDDTPTQTVNPAVDLSLSLFPED